MDTRMTDTKRSEKIRRILTFALAAAVAALCFTAFNAQSVMAEGEEDEKEDGRPDITIEVVEDIPAADIEEQETPLAESPDTAAADNTRQTMNIWILGAVVIAYTVFLITGSRRRKARMQMKAGTEGDRGRTSAGGRP